MNRVTSQRASGVEVLERRAMLDGAGVAAAVPDRFEAEDAELSGVIVDDLHGGFTGGGYADFVRGSGGYIFWNVNVQEAGRYELRFRYANGGSGDRPLEFRVNWERLDERLSFPRTGAWSRDAWNTVAVEADLKAGENVVQLISVGFNGSNFDSLTVTRQQHPTPPVTLAAEAATLGGAAKVSRAHAGYAGTGYVDFIRDAGDSMEWTLDVPPGQAGRHFLTFGFANGGVRDRAVALRVNGQIVRPELWFPRTGAWTNWSLLDNNFALEPVDLREGANQIRLTSIGYNGPNVDALRVYRGALPPITLQENSALLSGPIVRSDYAGYTGAGYVSFIHPSSDWLEWSFEMAESRPHQLEFRYANGGDTPITLELWFNGLSSVGGDRWRPVFAPTGSWSTWSTVRVGGGTASTTTPALAAGGLVRVRLNAIGQGGPNIDSMTVRAV